MNETRPRGEKHADNRIRAAAQTELGSAMTALMRYDATSRECRLVASTGLPAQLLDAAGFELVFALGEERGLVGLVAARRESIYVKNALSEPRWVPFMPSLRSAYFTPLLADDELLGVFIVFSVAVDALSAHERALADMHASEVARLWRVTGLVAALEGHVSATCSCDAGRHTGTCSVVAELRRLTQNDTGTPASLPGTAPNTVDLSGVSQRELEVVGALKRGLRLSQIARSLGISAHTARNHLKRVYRKLGVHSQVELLSVLASGGGALGSSPPAEASLRVLHAEDNLHDAERMRVALEQAGPGTLVTLAKDLSQAMALLAGSRQSYDVLLTVMSLPDGMGLELVAEVRARALPLPVVVLTAPARSDQVVSALKAGADDYLVKADDYLKRVPAALRAALERFRAEAVAARPLRVLYAEDNVADADLAIRHMQRYAAHVRMEIVRSGDEVLQRLPRHAADPADYDVLLLDYRLPGTNAFDLLKALRDERKLDIAVVVITGYSDGNVAAQAFHFGATEYLVKHPGHLSALPAVLQGACHRVALARGRHALGEQERALRESEARFRAFFEHLGVGVAQLDIEHGQTLRANQRYCDVFGYAHEEIVGSGFARLLHSEDAPLHQAKMDALQSGDLREFQEERRCVRKDGSHVWASITVTPLPADGEQPKQVIAVVQDITDQKLIQSAQRLDELRASVELERQRTEAERKRLEAQLGQAQKLGALGVMASGMVHDFNNLLSVIIANAEEIGSRLDVGHPAQQELEHLQLATARAAELVASVLAFGREDQKPLRPVLIRPLISEVLALLRSRVPSHVLLSTARAMSPGHVLGDATQLQQAIFNLCINAWQALEDEPGCIEVGIEESRLEAPMEGELAMLATGSYVHVYVRDTGCGMDAVTRERVFEPFFTTKPAGRGTGLGLSVVHGVVKNHGGLVTVESEVGVGSTFHLYLPALHSRAHEPVR